MENTLTQTSNNLLLTHSSGLAAAKQELAYWKSLEQDDITLQEIEKWAKEIEKYEKLIEEFLQKTPVAQEDWFTQFSDWIGKAFDVFWYIFKKIDH
ncbi:MAG: hypothetical protein ACHQJ4_06690 [Ignavibacteria bacterium]